MSGLGIVSDEESGPPSQIKDTAGFRPDRKLNKTGCPSPASLRHGPDPDTEPSGSPKTTI